ncbi:MAG: alpha/beta hydrolase [Cyanobacteria bacterium P01_H01_bin.15]
MELAVDIQGQGTPILCLHGHPGSAACLQVICDHLATNYQTIAPDLRGYGRSWTSQSFELTDHLVDLQALLDRLGIECCILLGWSLGGILALELALQQPERFSGLILIASAAAPRSDHPPIGWRDNLLTVLAGLCNQLQPGASWHIDRLGKHSLLQYLLQTHTPATYRYLATAGTPAFFKTSPAAHQSLNRALRGRYNRLPDLTQLTQPALVLAGSCDRHITPSASQATAEALPNSHFICYPYVAHLFPWEIPVRVNQDLQNWLQQKSL